MSDQQEQREGSDEYLESVLSAIEKARENQDWAAVSEFLDLKAREVEPTASEVIDHAKIVFNEGDPARAACMTRRALRMDPSNVDYKFQLADVYFDQKRFDESESIYREAIKVAPQNLDAKRRFAQVLQARAPQSEEAEALLIEIVDAEPENIQALVQLGALYAGERARYDEAQAIFERVLAISPNAPSALHNFGLLKRFQGDLETAEKYLSKACEVLPTDADFAFSLATCHLFKEDLDPALKWFNKAIELRPNNNAAKVYVAFVLFLQGKMKEGWAQYESRLALDIFKPIDYGRPRWDGDDLDGNTLLLLPEQGMGDNIQFVRYASLASERGGKVIVITHQNLLTLFESLENVHAVSTSAVGARNFHRYCPLLSLPYAFGTDEDSVPNDVPYLKAPPDKVETWRDKLASYNGPKVGLCWRGNPRHVNDFFRSSSLEQMRQLLDVDGINFFSLHKDRPDFEQELPDGLIDIGDQFEDFSDTAAAMENLDLVISVDTSICHLAGALARPTWIMLAQGPDFRWGLGTDTTPWYPTAKLFRQSELGDWSDVYERMITELRTFSIG